MEVTTVETRRRHPAACSANPGCRCARARCLRPRASRSTLYLLLDSLERAAGGSRRADGHAIRVRLFELGQRLFRAPRRVAGCVSRRGGGVRRAHNEVVQLAVLDGTEVVYIARKDRIARCGSSRISARALPAHCCALGKALLASLSERPLLAVFLPDRLQAVTPRATSTAPRERLRELAAVCGEAASRVNRKKRRWGLPASPRMWARRRSARGGGAPASCIHVRRGKDQRRHHAHGAAHRRAPGGHGKQRIARGRPTRPAGTPPTAGPAAMPAPAVPSPEAAAVSESPMTVTEAAAVALSAERDGVLQQPPPPQKPMLP